MPAKAFLSALLLSAILSAAGGAGVVSTQNAEEKRRTQSRPGARVESSSVMEIPIRQAHTNHVLVPVTVQGVGTQFVLDTAAGMTFITPETRAKLGHGRGDDGESREVAGAGGSVAAETTIVRSLVVGPHERKDLQVVVLDFKALQERVGEDFGGILGMDFLKDFDVRLDLRAKSLRLHPHDAPAVADEDGLRSLVKIPFRTFGSGFIFFDAEVGGRPVTGVMDVGAGHSIVNWRAAHA
ncbi:MAG: retropepsin-like aspartic protease family protein, partial [Pyrinomonadaceae bacterium]